jgi:membrane-bound lytic murein transglycosylase B
VLVLGGVVLWLVALMRLQDVATATGPAVDFGVRGAEPEAPAGPAADAGDGPVSGVTPPSGQPTAPDPAWVTRVAAADLRTRSEDPDCELSWATLAGIGWVESRHGTIQGNSLDADGRPAAGAIIGVPLNGEGPVAAIRDSDGGALDGDTEWDRAVGPHQFIPTTWARYGVDGDGDGIADPQDIDDSALAAARYLCANGSPLTDAGEWRRAVLTYNASEAYATDVVRATNFYARRSLEG